MSRFTLHIKGQQVELEYRELLKLQKTIESIVDQERLKEEELHHQALEDEPPWDSETASDDSVMYHQMKQKRMIKRSKNTIDFLKNDLPKLKEMGYIVREYMANSFHISKGDKKVSFFPPSNKLHIHETNKWIKVYRREDGLLSGTIICYLK